MKTLIAVGVALSLVSEFGILVVGRCVLRFSSSIAEYEYLLNGGKGGTSYGGRSSSVMGGSASSDSDLDNS